MCSNIEQEVQRLPFAPLLSPCTASLLSASQGRGAFAETDEPGLTHLHHPERFIVKPGLFSVATLLLTLRHLTPLIFLLPLTSCTPPVSCYLFCLQISKLYSASLLCPCITETSYIHPLFFSFF